MSSIEFTLNGQSVQAPAGKSIFNIAKDLGIDIPHLCHQEGLAPDGNCRACVVEIDGEDRPVLPEGAMIVLLGYSPELTHYIVKAAFTAHQNPIKVFMEEVRVFFHSAIVYNVAKASFALKIACPLF